MNPAPSGPLPPLLSIEEIRARLREIFPEGAPNRNYCVRDMSAATVFVMLYVGAVEGTAWYLAPKHVYTMTDIQAGKQANEDREEYRRTGLSPGYRPQGKRWYADTSREPIRDETLRYGLVPVGGVVVAQDIATTSSRPRYALVQDFARRFSPDLTGEALREAIAEWQQRHLSASALARSRLLSAGVGPSHEGILVRFPNGETRRLAPGWASMIAKGVIEEFAPRYLRSPGVLWLSEPGRKVVQQDAERAAMLGLTIDPSRELPDIILVDLHLDPPLVVFVEIVVSNGAITDIRRKQLLALFGPSTIVPRERVQFLTAYRDREHQGFRKTIASVAWGTRIWFLTDPDRLVIFGQPPSPPPAE